MKLVGMAVFAAMMVAVPAKAEQWRAVSENEQKPMTLMFVDQSTVKRSGDFATGWVLTVLEADPEGKRDWNHSVIYRKVDCVNKVSQMVHSKFYADDSLLEDNEDPGDFLPIREGSMVEGVADVMCGRAEYLTEVVDDPLALSKTYFSGSN